MTDISILQGVWKATISEEMGSQRSNEELQPSSHLVILAEKLVSDSDGIWGAVKYHLLPVPEMVEESIQAIKQLISGQEYKRSNYFHIYSGGVLRLVEKDGIDFMVYHGPELYSLEVEHSINRGIYQCDATGLALCLADSKTNRRPTQFDSTQSPYQSLIFYVREQFAEL